MKIGILGAGYIATEFLKISSKFDLEKIYILASNNNQDKVQLLQNRYSIDKIFFDYDEMLRSDMNVIYIALPNHLHYTFAKRALLKGKNVIVEKPIVTNSTEFLDLIKIAREKKLIILEAMNVYYLPAYESIKKSINDIGDIKIISLNYSQYSSKYNSFKNGVVYSVFDKNKDGGALADINVYNIHMAVGLFGEPDNITYEANIKKGIDISGILLLKYKSCIVSCIGTKDCKAPSRSAIQGETLSVVWDDPVNQIKSYKITNNKDIEKVFVFDRQEHRLYYQFHEFFKIIQENNFNKSQILLENSSIVVKILEEAKSQWKNKVM